VVAFAAVFVAVFGVMASAAAALATFLAVVKPIERRMLEDKAATEVAMEAFAADLLELRYNIGGTALLLPTVDPDGEPGKTNALVRSISRPVIAVPSLTPTPENVLLVKQLNRLRMAVAHWDKRISTFDVAPHPDYPSYYAEFVVDDLKSSFDGLMHEIRQTMVKIVPFAAEYADELLWVSARGDGFIAFYNGKK